MRALTEEQSLQPHIQIRQRGRRQAGPCDRSGGAPSSTALPSFHVRQAAAWTSGNATPVEWFGQRQFATLTVAAWCLPGRFLLIRQAGRTVHSGSMDLGPARLDELPAPDVLHAIRANWAEYYTHVGQAPGVELSEGPHLSWALTGIPDPFLNVVFRTNLPPDEPASVVDEALAHFRVKGIPTLSWLDPAPEVGPHLLSRGLSFSEGGRGMAADLAALPDSLPMSPGVAIVAVEDRASFQSWIHLMRVGFGTPEAAEPDLLRVFAAVGSGPHIRTYLALLDGQPVATSQVLLAAGVAGIYQVTCLPDARGRGIGTAVTLAALLEARRRGYAAAILQASDLGYPVYRRLGFRDYGRLNEYRYRGEQHPDVGR